MATNPPKGDGHRNGQVRERSQTFNPRTEQFVKRDTNTGRFMDVKLSPVTSKCATCDHFKVHHLGWVFSDGLRGWLARS